VASSQPGKGTAAKGDAAVGGYADAYCGKCKEVTSHIVLAKKGTAPSRVECRTCHAMHLYKASASASASSGKTGTKPRASRAAEPKPEEAWAAAMRQGRGEPIKYQPSGQYVGGNRLNHATFGEGVVVRISSATVCEVVFKTGTVKLIMGSGQARRPS
jgi:hypothetical protein